MAQTVGADNEERIDPPLDAPIGSDGDYRPDDPEWVSEFLDSLEPWVDYAAWRYAWRGSEIADLRQEGLIACWKAIATFQVGDHRNVRSWAKRNTLWACSTYARSNLRRYRRVVAIDNGTLAVVLPEQSVPSAEDEYLSVVTSDGSFENALEAVASLSEENQVVSRSAERAAAARAYHPAQLAKLLYPDRFGR